MKNKVYIMDNEEQEQNILTKLENEGCVWHSDSTKLTEYIPSKHFIIGEKFPTAIVKMFNNRIMYETNYEDGSIKQDEEIVYDGRKEEQMSDKYVVSYEFMDELEEWKSELSTNGKCYIFEEDIYELPSVVETWWKECMEKSDEETNNRLIAILRWVQGEDVFEVEKPKKWVVRSKEEVIKGHYSYVSLIINKKDTVTLYDEFNAIKFDTKEEAESWANSHQEVIEVEG